MGIFAATVFPRLRQGVAAGRGRRRRVSQRAAATTPQGARAACAGRCWQLSLLTGRRLGLGPRRSAVGSHAESSGQRVRPVALRLSWSRCCADRRRGRLHVEAAHRDRLSCDDDGRQRAGQSPVQLLALRLRQRLREAPRLRELLGRCQRWGRRGRRRRSRQGRHGPGTAAPRSSRHPDSRYSSPVLFCAGAQGLVATKQT
jgi:hypothetical protein